MMMARAGREARRVVSPGAWLVLALAAAGALAGCTHADEMALWPSQVHYEQLGKMDRHFYLAHGLMPQTPLQSLDNRMYSLVVFSFSHDAGRQEAKVALIESMVHKVGSGEYTYFTHIYPNPSNIPDLERHWQARLNSPYLRPLRISFDGRDCWVVLSGMPALTGEAEKSSLPNAVLAYPDREDRRKVFHLEFYFRDPAAGFTLPDGIWAIGVMGSSLWEMDRGIYSDALYTMYGKFYGPPEIERNQFGALTKVKIAPWTPPPPEKILEGVRYGVRPDKLPQLGVLLNQRLLEWKTKELAEALPGYGKEQLQDLVVRLEKALLDLDLEIRKFKEAQDEAARFVPAPGKAQAPPKVEAWEVERSHIFAQRKAIVMAIMDMVKRALAQKRGSD